MRKALILAAVLLQVAVLAFMAGEREYIVGRGKVIRLRTAPIDPRDLFRGDYVRLSYEISRLGAGSIKGAEYAKKIEKDDKIYVSLQGEPDGLYEFVQAQLQRPKDGVYLTGRSLHSHPSIQPGHPIAVNYGIEAYFVEQGTGREIETRRGERTGLQVPLEMEIAVGSEGQAVLKGYRWSPLAIGLQVLRSAAQSAQDPQAPKSATVRLTLANASDSPLAIVDLPNHCSFSLEPVPWAKKRWAPANAACESALPAEAGVILLLPKQEKSLDIDFSSARWLVRADGNAAEIGTLDWSEQFRIVYRPPDPKACRELNHSELIWHGYLPTRVFHGRGQID